MTDATTQRTTKKESLIKEPTTKRIESAKEHMLESIIANGVIISQQ